MSAINRLPLGWLGFLGIKNGGQYPSETSQVLSPVWDLTQLYTFGNSEIDNVVQAIAAVGNTSYTTVPNGEAWLVLQQSAATDTLGAGQSFRAALNWTDPAALVNIETSQVNPTATVGERYVIANFAKDCYLAGPGSRLGITCTVLVAGPVNFRLKTRFARFSL
jgi:hypothetical protein